MSVPGAGTDNRLILETTFPDRFGNVLAASAGADGKVSTALTATRYIHYDWTAGQYVTEPR